MEEVRERFGVAEVVLVGDRGMISQKQIDALRNYKSLSRVERAFDLIAEIGV